MTKVVPSERAPTEPRVVRTITRGDTTYELFTGPCKCGRRPAFRLIRTYGAALSVYEISPEDSENLDGYVDKLHMNFSFDVVMKLAELREQSWSLIQRACSKLKECTLSEEHVVESGKHSERPKLSQALEACRRLKAKLVIAKLERRRRINSLPMSCP